MNAPLRYPTAESTGETVVDTLIIGAGFSGMCMAIKLTEAGKRSFVLLEKGNDVGGTWRDNTYPGCACDVASHLYSYSFEPKADWSRMYGPQPEIWDYQKRIARKYDLYPHCRFNEAMAHAEYDEQAKRWHVTSTTGSRYIARILVSGVGALCLPSIPHLKGIENFEGEAFHSAHWNHDYDFAGKRVAVIGTGASAIQFVPAIQPRVSRLTLFQRTAPWVMPKEDRPITAREKWAFRNIPGLRWLFRNRIFWRNEIFTLGFTSFPKMLKKAEKLGREYFDSVVKDPVLAEKLRPTYDLGCKRVLLSNDYYPALVQPNVDVVTDGVAEVRAHSIVTTAGEEIEIDAIIYGTGFKATEPLADISIKGRDGIDLNESWAKVGGPEAYYGITASGFPNFFMLLGPNTGLGSSSIILMIEAQVHYVMEALKLMERENLAALEIREEVQAGFNQKLQDDIKNTIWSSGCNSWYIAESGKNPTIWPSLTLSYWAQTLRIHPEDYICEKQEPAALPQAAD
ncbi:MAG: NAD(P)-binding protein [Rhizobiales bacterium]|nr:NAD(P)-binding protein [Hyphomicrobiales bacterium]